MTFTKEKTIKVAVLADTHIPKRARALPRAAQDIVSSADVIIHAGDVISEEFLQSLYDIAPVYAVLGNNDLLFTLPETLQFKLDNVTIAVIHDSGQKEGRAARMRKLFPQADIVVFGHSHIPMNIQENGQLLFNPGSPTDRRQQPNHTMGVFLIEGGTLQAEIINLD